MSYTGQTVLLCRLLQADPCLGFFMVYFVIFMPFVVIHQISVRLELTLENVNSSVTNSNVNSNLMDICKAFDMEIELQCATCYGPVTW